MSESEEQGASGSYTGIQLQGGSSSSSSMGGGGGVVVGGGAWRVNKEVALPILLALKSSLEAEIKQVKRLINMVHGEEVLAVEEEDEDEDDDDDQIAYQREIQKKALADEQDESLELQMQIEIMKLTLSCSGGTASY